MHACHCIPHPAGAATLCSRRFCSTGVGNRIAVRPVDCPGLSCLSCLRGLLWCLAACCLRTRLQPSPRSSLHSCPHGPCHVQYRRDEPCSHRAVITITRPPRFQYLHCHTYSFLPIYILAFRSVHSASIVPFQPAPAPTAATASRPARGYLLCCFASCLARCFLPGFLRFHSLPPSHVLLDDGGAGVFQVGFGCRAPRSSAPRQPASRPTA